jgi:transcriptional regulator with XRE-family HTH domain
VTVDSGGGGKADMSGTPELKTPGEVIAGARRRRGLSVEDLAERTKIPPSMLRAIEVDEYHRLSEPLYAKSFLRTCAKELGLAVDDILDLYARHLGETPRQAGESPGVEEVVRIRRVGVPWARLSVGALVVVAVAATVFVLNRRGADVSVPSPAIPAGGAREAPVTGQARWPDGDSPAQASVPPPVEEVSGNATDEVPAGVPGLAFSDDLTWPVVVRLRVPGPITARARRDGDEQFGDVVWPDSVPAVPVPAAGVMAGRAYAAGDGLVVYWGAAESLSLVLGIANGVELTVNGEPQLLHLPADGSEIILDLRAAPTARLP